MSYKLSTQEMNQVFAKLMEKYDVYAPKRFKNEGPYSDTDIIKYAKIASLDEVEWNEKSDYPMKEVLSPIQQAIFYFTEDEFREAKEKHVQCLFSHVHVTSTL